MTPNDFDNGESYKIVEVGEVVSKNTETDSLIFDIQHPYMNGKVDLVNPVPPRSDTKVVLYGAMHRGEAGLVTIPSKPSAGMVSKKGDIGISSLGTGAQPLTSGSDCGTIYVTEDGLALAMHHCLQGEEASYVSFGIPLPSILAKHSLLGGEPDGIAAESQQCMTSPSVHQLTKAPRDKHSESRNITKFDTKITKAVPPLGSAPIDEAGIYESRDIAHFKNIRIDTHQALMSIQTLVNRNVDMTILHTGRQRIIVEDDHNCTDHTTNDVTTCIIKAYDEPRSRAARVVMVPMHRNLHGYSSDDYRSC
jgi:hypothetical protein